VTRLLIAAIAMSVAWSSPAFGHVLHDATQTPDTAQTRDVTQQAHSSPQTHDVHAQTHDQEHTPPQESDQEPPPVVTLPPFIPPVTDADRAAAFPDVPGHAVHDTAIHSFVLFDRLEWQTTRVGRGLVIDSEGWIGGDRDRLWFRAEGDGNARGVDQANVDVLYGRMFARWWDVVAGVRQDVAPGPARTWAAIGVQGLAPYWFEVDATAYVSASGRVRVRFDVEYELRLSNRLIVQPRIDATVLGTPDRERGLDAGLGMVDAGIRVRYEIRRQFAPYIGVAWHDARGQTVDVTDVAGESSRGARLVTGVRMWF
jgi:copper resistance protein B